MVTRKRVLRWASLVGVALFVFLLSKIGPRQIWDDVKRLTGLSFLILVFLRMIFWASRTLIWRIIYRSYGCQASFLNLFSARLAGNAVSYLTPGAFFGGEAIRAMMVDTANRKKCLASIVVDRSLEISSIIFFAVIAAIIAVTRIPMSFRAKAILAMLIAFLSAFILFMLAKQRQGFFRWIIDALGKVRIRFKFLEKNMPKIRETDEHISAFYSRHKKTFFFGLILYALAHFYWIAEIYFTLVFMGVEGVTILKAFLVVSLSLFGFMIPAIPASLGTLEITNVALFALLGLGAGTGFSMTIIRRIVGLVWAGVGLLWMGLRRVAH